MNQLNVKSESSDLVKPTRGKILDLEASISELPDSLSVEDMEDKYNEHFFAPGVYTRKMFIPQGMVVVGKIHNHAHMNIITYGVIKVVTEFGEDVFTGPRTWISEPGTKRAVVALEDTEWLTIHPNPSDTEDLKTIEEYVIAPDYDSFDRLMIESGD
jgi:hypothetical protein